MHYNYQNLIISSMFCVMKKLPVHFQSFFVILRIYKCETDLHMSEKSTNAV